jgi:peptidoglycan/LPS O-acetylase OafA/YrhL
MNKRNANLDLVRAVAILLVLVFHAPEYIGSLVSPVIRDNGFLGVNLFFVLSGLLIGRIYFSESARGDFSVTRFWGRRWLRTIPPYVAIVCIWAIAQAARGGSPLPPWPYTVFLQNYLSEPYLGEMPFSWSLCVEEHFYLTLPLIGLLAAKKRLSPFILVLAAVPTLARWIGDAPLKATHLHFDGLLYGVLLAHTRHWDAELYARLFRPRRLLWMVAAAFLVAALLSPLWLKHSLANISFAITTGAAACAPAWRAASSRLVHLIAATSYSAYLVHGYAYIACDSLTRSYPFLMRIAILFIGTTVATGVFYLLFEKPSFWLRERICPAARRGSTG